MSDPISHECGIAVIRLLKPLDYYHKKYGTAFYGVQKMQLLLQKMRNRGQDGAGMATIKLNPQPGARYISRKRSNAPNYLTDLFEMVWARLNNTTKEQQNDPAWLKANMPYMGEVLMGHLRYGTHGDNSIELVHPFHRQNNWISRNLLLAGNFNMTNVDELFQELVDLGQYPKEKSDTVTVLEKIGHFLDDEVQRLHTWYKPDGYRNPEVNQLIFENLDIQRLLRRASKKFDGGYVLGGLLGHGDAFLMRDPNGIRPAYWYMDDEVVVGASERPAIQSVFNVRFKNVRELKPGHALIVKLNGKVDELPFCEPREKKACSFERIYFSRGNDASIYQERQDLGKNIVPRVLQEVNYDLENTVFSFIPNTAETAFYGMIKALEDHLNDVKIEKLTSGTWTNEEIESIVRKRARIEKIAIKDVKMRTFITQDSARDEMVSHVYDVTHGTVKPGVDTLVVIDDSIVRGTTLKKSIIKMLDRLEPKRIIIVSSAPQIRYPDCYGIDMAKMGDFIAFQAIVALLKRDGKEGILDVVYLKCKEQEGVPKEQVRNYVKEVYEAYTQEEISEMVAKLVTPEGTKAKVSVLFQTIEGLHKSCPNNQGDWYFSGNYPTPGGNKVVNKAFINYMEGRTERAY